LVRYVDETFKNTEISLPTKNWKIDFEFMESFIEKLEKEKIEKLNNYLEVSWLKDCELNEKEKKVLEDFENGKFEWGDFKLWDLFNINTYKKRFDANKLTISKTGEPYVVRTALNNWIRWYIDENKEFLNEWNTISFWQDTATMFYQEKPYFTWDKIKILKSKNNNFNKTNWLFFVSTMTKSFTSFTWWSSSFNIKIIWNQLIQFPIKNNEPDYEIMEILISAVQKIVVKDLVEYGERKV
jgi:ankyrin repeat protein